MKDILWKTEWFENVPKYSHSFWDSIGNQRKFLEELAAKYSISCPSDWRRVTCALIHKNGGMV